MEFYAPLSYQQISFFLKVKNNELDEKEFQRDVEFLSSNFDTDITPEKFAKEVLPKYALIRPSNLKHAIFLKDIGVSKLFLDNGIIQKKTVFTVRKAIAFIDKIEPFLDYFDYFVVPDNPLWKYTKLEDKVSMFELNLTIGNELKEIVDVQKAILPVHFDTDVSDLSLRRIPTRLLWMYEWYALPYRPVDTFRGRFYQLNYLVNKDEMHILALNTSRPEIFNLVRHTHSFDTAMYNLMGGKFNVMIRKDGTIRRIFRVLNKQQKMLLSLNNMKFYPLYLKEKLKMEVCS